MARTEPTSRAAAELMAKYEDYKGTVSGRVKDTAEKAKTTTPAELWNDKVAMTFPPLPSNSIGGVKVSKLLKVSSKKLPGPDFDMPMFSQSESWPEDVKQYIPTLDEPDIENYVFSTVPAYWFCYAIRLNKPAFLSGVKGCGKSTMPKRLAAELNWPFLRKQMSKTLDSTEFFGNWTVKDGETKFALGDLPQAAMAGMIMVVDEFSNAPNELHPSLHQVLEKNGRIYLNSSDGTIAEKIIEPTETFRIVATDNTRGQGDTRGHYAGTDVVNSATMDRFRVMIVMNYMTKAAEKQVLMDTVPQCTDLLAGLMIDVATKVRAAYDAGDMSETLSLRPLIEWAEKAVFTKDIMGALEYTMLNKIDSDSERQEIISYVKTVFGSLLD